MNAEVDRAFREAVGTFRRISIAESQSAKPLHLRIITVEPGDTIERLASRMATPDHQAERFHILNGLGPNAHVNAGEEMKLIVE